MCYRNVATVDFSGGRLWALVGRNGAGKSALFDAITYVLYGVHRGGVHGAEELINHQADHLAVELDFQLGADLFRVRRALRRHGGAANQAWQRRERDDGPAWEPIPDTASRQGFAAWVMCTLGLDDRTFTASVLLQQGRSDALLTAKPHERHAMLGQLLDLAKYERLAERAKQNGEQERRTASDRATSLAATPAVTEEQLASAARTAAAAARAVRDGQGGLERLAGIAVQAVQWQSAEGERRALLKRRDAAAALLCSAAQIRQDAARRTELDSLLPPLRQMLATRAGWEQSRDALTSLQATVREATARRQTAFEAREGAVKRRAALEAARDAALNRQAAALRCLTELAPDLAAVAALERERERLAALDQELSAYKADLDAAVQAKEGEVAALVQRREALPWLGQYHQAREAWTTAECERRATEQEAARLTGAQERLTEDRRLSQADVAAAQEATRRARDEQATSDELLRAAREQVKRFTEVESAPTCRYCGLPLTEEHRAKERERVNGEVVAAEASAKAARQRARETERAGRGMDERLQALEAQLSAVTAERQQAVQSAALARQRQTQAEAEARRAVAASALARNSLLRADPDSPISEAFSLLYPTREDLRVETTAVSSLDAGQRALQDLRTLRAARDQQRAQRVPLAASVAAAAGVYPEAAIARLGQAAESATQDCQAADIELARLGSDVHAEQRHLDEAQRTLERADAQAEQVSSDVTAEAARASERRQALDDALAALPPAWQEKAPTLTPADGAVLTDEYASLQAAPARLLELERAQGERTEIERQIAERDAQIAAIHPEARRPRDQIEAVINCARAAHNVAETTWGQADDARRELLVRRTRRAEWEAERVAAAREAYLSSELARYLGRDHLQRHLLRQAEQGIVQQANEVLDHLSAGALRLKLRGAEDGNKALDLLAYNRQTGDEALRVDFLSGSQRFRVAVSLAIGIGRYAGDGTRHMESVIIDEGFGGLDQEGLRAMGDELHRLGDLLGRIIIVSHQEEFARDFVHKYEIRLEDGSSRVALAE